MAIERAGPVFAGRVGPPTAASGMPAKARIQGPDSAGRQTAVTLSEEALARYRDTIPDPEADKQRRIDQRIASWFKHLSPAQSEADRRATAEEDHHKRLARAAGRVWSDPGHVPDPVKEPGRATVGLALDITDTDQLLKAIQQPPDPATANQAPSGRLTFRER